MMLKMKLKTIDPININLKENEKVKTTLGISMPSSTTNSETNNYLQLLNKPKINNVELVGNKSFKDLGIGQDFVKDNNYVHTDNNYSNNDKNKLYNLQNYDDTKIQQDINSLNSNKADRTEIPNVSNFITKSVDDLANYYLKTQTYTKSEVNTLISNINSFSVEVVDALPTAQIETHTIYLVAKEENENDNYDEFIFINNNWEHIGNTTVDLTDYATKNYVSQQISDFLTQPQVEIIVSNALIDYYDKTQVANLLNTKQKTLVSGTNIKTINNQSILGEGNINISCDFSISDLYTIGSIYVNSINNPLAFGQWELIGKSLEEKSWSPDNDIFTPQNTDIAIVDGISVIRSSDVVRIRLRVILKQNRTAAQMDTTLVVGNLDLTKLGISKLGASYVAIDGADNANTVISTSMTASGKLEIVDTYPQSSVSANTSFYSTYICPIASQNMLDEACNRFFFKRIA